MASRLRRFETPASQAEGREAGKWLLIGAGAWFVGGMLDVFLIPSFRGWGILGWVLTYALPAPGLILFVLGFKHLRAQIHLEVEQIRDPQVNPDVSTWERINEHPWAFALIVSISVFACSMAFVLVTG